MGRIPPTLAPPSGAALARGAVAAILGTCAGTVAREMGALFPGFRVVPFGSGRAALATAIGAAMRATGRRRIALPAFTSYSVAAAAATAGAEVVLVDMDPATLDFDRESLERNVDHRTAAVVLGNLFGFPSLTHDLGFVRERGVLLVDDAAQALGATEQGRPVGGRGDFGVLSFGRGKCVTTGQGGALLLPEANGAAGAVLPQGRQGLGVNAWFVAASVALSRSRVVFGMLSGLPGVRVGESHYDSRVELAPISRAAEGLAADLAAAVGRQQAIRARVAGLWQEHLGGTVRFVMLRPAPGCEAAYLRVPLLAPDASERTAASRRLARIGLAYARSYPLALSKLEAFAPVCVAKEPVPQAELLAETLIALPCHVGLDRRIVMRAAEALAGSQAASTKGGH